MRILAATQKSFSVLTVLLVSATRQASYSFRIIWENFLPQQWRCSWCCKWQKCIIFHFNDLFTFLSQAWQEQLRMRAMQNFTKPNRPGQWKSGFWMKIRLRPPRLRCLANDWGRTGTCRRTCCQTSGGRTQELSVPFVTKTRQLSARDQFSRETRFMTSQIFTVFLEVSDR